MFKYVSQTADYCVCNTWDGTTEGTVGVLIAKDTLLRAVGTRTIDGKVITYTGTYNWADQTRVASYSGTTETQVIVPRYCDNDIIYAVNIGEKRTGVSGVDWLDVNTSGRAWAKKYVPPS
jgi:hypothetical protein